MIKAVNSVRSIALNYRLFEQLCDANDEDFQRLLVNTEGNVLKLRGKHNNILLTLLFSGK